MARKRKNPDAPVVRINRPRHQLPPRNRTVSVHTTAAGRLGQSTSFVPSADTLPPPEHTSNSSTAEIDLTTTDVDYGGPEAGAEDDEGDSRDDEGDSNNDEGDSESEIDEKSLADSPLQEWARVHRDSYLDEMLRHKGRAGVVSCGEKCGREGIYKCKDCFGFQLVCRECFAERHSHSPLHRVLVRPRCLTCNT
jgi:hypothetical protein